jgi:hypothetical protein
MLATEIETLKATDPADADRWSTLVQAAAVPDVYYLPAYARATAELEGSEPIAIVAGSQECKILAPLLVRRMSAGVNGSRFEWVDASSPYGYGGLLNLSASQKVDKHDVHCFVEALHQWCRKSQAVCCVLRLHPLLRQEEWFVPEQFEQNSVRVWFRGLTSAINLDAWDAPLSRPRGLRRDRRAHLNRARRLLRVSWMSGEDRNAEAGLELFSQIYGKALDVLDADRFYRFPARYFSSLRFLERQLGIAFAWLGDELVGANMFLAGRKYAHGHLAGIDEAGRKHGAATLLLVEGSRWARQRGCELLHLGGGMTPGDGLEDFKRSFGGPSFRYGYVTYVADQERFEQICQMPDPPWPYGIMGMPETLQGNGRNIYLKPQDFLRP